MNSNIEVGIEVAGRDVQGLIRWYDGNRATAIRIETGRLAELQKKAGRLRHDFAKLRARANEKLAFPRNERALSPARDDVHALFENATQYLHVCNTDRRHETYRRRAAMNSKKRCIAADSPPPGSHSNFQPTCSRSNAATRF